MTSPRFRTAWYVAAICLLVAVDRTTTAVTAPTAIIAAPAVVSFGDDISVSGASSIADAGRSIVEYRWRLDGGDVTVVSDPVHTFVFSPATPFAVGEHTVELVVVDDIATASAPVLKRVIVRDTVAPTAVIELPALVLFGQGVTATGDDSFDVGGTLSEYRWRLDNGPTVVTESPSHTFAFNAGQPFAIGLHTVQLIVVDDSGNESAPDAKQFFVRDTAAPSAVLEAPTVVAFGASVPVSGADSVDVGGSIVSYRWALDGGAVIVTSDPSFTFIVTPDDPLPLGTHTVSLVVVDDSGNESPPDSRSFQVLDNHVPTAVATAPATVPFGQSFTASGVNSVDFDGTIVDYVWRLDGGSPVVTDVPTFTFVFSLASPLPLGVHTVSLVVRDDHGNLSEADFVNVRVIDNHAPTAVIEAPAIVIFGRDITVSGAESIDIGGEIAQYRWRLDGGDVVVTDAPSYTFPLDPAQPFFPGLHIVELVVVDDSGNESSPDAAHVRVTDGIAPTAVLQVPAVVQVGYDVAVSGAESVDIGGEVLLYQWALDSGSVLETDVPNFIFHVDPANPLALGLHTVSLVVMDDSGNVSPPDVKQFVVADSIAPTAVITAPATIVAGQLLAVSGASSIDVGGTIVRYEWRLDDGPVIALDEPALTFPAAPALGEHVVRLVVVDDSGNESPPVFRSVQVVPPPDTLVPTILITTPAQGAVYRLGQVVNAEYTCTDADSGIASCNGPVAHGSPIDTATVGTKQFKVTATDNAGNAAEATHTYSVEYNFAGFFSPVDNLPVVNSGNAGRTFPIKWRVASANGTPVTSLASFVSMLDSPIACDAAPIDVLEEQLSSTTGAALHYDAAADQFVFNWKTQKAWIGCRLLQLTLADGSRHYAKFRLR
jgi:hypothetical protein